MANIAFRLESRPTFRDLQGRFAQANRELLEDRRDMVRILGRQFKVFAQQEAPKKSSAFASAINFRTFVGGDSVGFNVYAPEPLSTFIREGTRPHIIAGSPLLAFFWERVGRRMVLPFVNHPGTQANDYLQRAYDQWQPYAEGQLRRISTRWVARVT